MKRFNVEKVESAIGYHFSNHKLLKQAFFRSSFAHENGRESNEVLEFIGDKVLDLAVMRILLEKYAKSNNGEEYFKSSKQEGELTRIKSELVSTGYLAGSFDALFLEEYIYYGKSDLNNKTTDVMSIKEDVFEAIIGAIALDSNWNFNKIIKIVKKLLHTDEFLLQSDISTNYVGILQERCAELKLGTPNYVLQQLVQNGSAFWHATLKVKGIKQTVYGTGFKQKEAKKSAAKKMVELVEAYASNSIKSRNVQDREEVFSAINTYVQLGIIDKPEYEFEESYDEDGNPQWECGALVNSLGYIYYGYGSTKKDAQKDALIQVLEDIEQQPQSHGVSSLFS